MEPGIRTYTAAVSLPSQRRTGRGQAALGMPAAHAASGPSPAAGTPLAISTPQDHAGGRTPRPYLALHDMLDQLTKLWFTPANGQGCGRQLAFKVLLPDRTSRRQTS